MAMASLTNTAVIILHGLNAINGYNLQLFNEDGTACYLNRDEVKEALTFMKNLNELNQGYNVKANDFDKGKIVFAPMPFSQYRAYKPYPWSIKKIFYI